MLSKRLAIAYRIISIGILVGILAFSGKQILGLAAPNLQAADFQEIDAYVQKAMKSARIPGLAYGIVKGNKIVHLQAYGINDFTGDAITPQTPFLIGSVGKTITALAIQQLINAEKVEIDSPVQRYIPWFRLADEEASKTITIRQLLTHTSGLSNGDGVNPKFHSSDRYTNEELVRSLTNVHINRPVGSSQEYSNLNFIILGQVVEQVSGKSYQEYVQENIFDPLEMTNSYMDITQARQAGMAPGHRVLFGFLVQTNLPYPKGTVSAGYHISTAEDMSRLLIAHLSQGMFQGKSLLFPEGEPSAAIVAAGSYYDIHWIPLESIQNGYTDGQSGSTLDYSACYYILPYHRIGVVVLSNANTAEATQTMSTQTIAFNILEMASGFSGRTSAPSITTVYVGIDLILLALLTIPTLQLIRMRLWRDRQLRRNLKSTNPMIPTILVNFALPLLLLVSIPIFMTATMVPGMSLIGAWPFLTYILPDIGFTLLALIVLLIVVGIIKILFLNRLEEIATTK